MKIATADFAGGARSAIKRGQRRWGRSRGDRHGWGGRRYLALYISPQRGRGMSASHRTHGYFSKRLETRPLVDQLRDDRDIVHIEEFTSRGRSLLWLCVEQLLKWVIAAPGATLPGSHLDIWCWRLQHYDSSQECLLTLADLERLAPATIEWSRVAHLRATEDLKRLHRDEGGSLEILITQLEEEMRVAVTTSRDGEPGAQVRQWASPRLNFRPVAVRWLSTPGLAAGGGKALTVGEEHSGRFRVAFIAEKATAEAEVDLKRSMVTVHSVDGQPPLLVAGKALEAKLSLPVTDSAIGENPPELRIGKQLCEELERVVCIG